MRILRKWFVLIPIVLFALGCEKDETPPSTATVISNFYLSSIDTTEAVDYAIFKVNTDTFFVYDGVTYTGFIQNRDSMLFGTSLKEVIPTITTIGVVSSILLSDSIAYTASDTLNFEKPIRVKVFAQNKDTTQLYLIKANVHQLDHELYLWDERDYPHTELVINAERAVMVNGSIYLFRQLGDNVILHINSAAGKGTWQEKEPTVLPVGAIPTIIFSQKFYAIADGNIYTSDDGQSWSSSLLNIELKELLFGQNGELFALTNDGVVSSTDDGQSWTLVYVCENDFPIRDFSVVSEQSPSGRMRYALVGGVTKNGNESTIWSTENGHYWVNFSRDRANLPSRNKAAVIAYDHSLLMFGGIENGSLASNVLFSPDFGLTWMDANSKIAPKAYIPTTESSVLNGDEWRIFIVGGKDATGKFVQRIWSGRKNETFFDEYR